MNKPDETAEQLRTRAAWELERADKYVELAESCRGCAAALIAQAEQIEQRRGAYRWLRRA